MNIIVLIVLLAASFTLSWGRPQSYELTPCQRHQRYPNSTGFEVDVKCDHMGNYEPLQCTKHSPKRCACYFPERNAMDFDNEIETCECHMEWFKGYALGKRMCHLPACLPSGFYGPKRCCWLVGGHRMCQCQDTSSGERIEGPDYDPTCASGAYQVASTEKKTTKRPDGKNEKPGGGSFP